MWNIPRNRVSFGAAIVLWLWRHWFQSLSVSRGDQTGGGKLLKGYLYVNLSMFAQGVYICDIIQYMQFIVSCKHTNAQVFTVKTEVAWGFRPKPSHRFKPQHTEPRVACCLTYVCTVGDCGPSTNTQTHKHTHTHTHTDSFILSS